jgi:hypothetical protein
MMLFPYRNDPATGSLIPSMSTGGAAINAIMKHVTAVSKQGIINTPNQPTYKRLFVDVTHSQNSGQPVKELRSLTSIAVAILII